jgi:hypothetical protein
MHSRFNFGLLDKEWRVGYLRYLLFQGRPALYSYGACGERLDEAALKDLWLRAKATSL